jgi:hypothetical protein
MRLYGGFPQLALAPLLAALTLVPAPARAADPTTQECVSTNEQAGPLQQAGKLRQARANMRRCSAQSCPAVVRDDCIRAATQLDAAVPTIVFEAHDAAGNEISAVRVTMDGEEVASRLAGTVLDVDPGEHTFQFESAAGNVEKRLVIHQAEKNRREAVSFGPEAGRAPGSGAAGAGTAGQAGPGTGEGSAGGMSGQKKVAIAVGGLGVAAVAAGSILGLLASAKWQQAKNDCGAACALGSTAQNEASSAHTTATIANITFGVGVLGVGAGLALWLLAPSGSAATGWRVSPLVACSGGGLVAARSLP